MKHITTLLAAFALLFTGCETLTTGDNSEVKDLAFNFGVKIAVYKAAQQNPEYIDLGNAIASVLEGNGADVADTQLMDYITGELIPKYIEKPEDRILATELVRSFYALFKTKIDELAAKASLPVLAQSIRAGLSYAEMNPDQ